MTLALTARAVRATILSVLAALPGASPGAAQDRPAAPCGGSPQADRVARVEPGGEITLASGRAVRLADLRFPEPSGPDAAAAAPGRLAFLAGQEVLVTPVGEADRWGRVPALVAIPAGQGPAGAIDVADLLVGEGWARVDAGERDALCRPDLLGVEATARLRRRGLWATSPEPLPAAEPDRLPAQSGRFLIVEGRVASVRERRDRTYINFGRDFARDFSVSVPRRSWAALKRAGLSAESLTGRVVRVRGTLDVRRGPTMEIVSADMIERIESGRARR